MCFLDLDALHKNMHEIQEKAESKNIRIASKSIRSIEVLKTILSSSDSFKGIMCFTGDEALYLFEQGFDDLLVAYPIWSKVHLKDILLALKEGADITVMIDSLDHLERLEAIAAEYDGVFKVCMDLDLSTTFAGLHFGVFRSSVKRAEDAILLAKRIKQSQYIRLTGLMGYEAQIAGLTDQDPAKKVKSSVIRLLKKQSLKEIRERRTEVIKAITHLGMDLQFINGGGTGSIESTKTEELITEITVGSGFYNSHLFDKYADFKYRPAAGFAIEITRKPANHIYTCYGGGYIASGAAGMDKLPEVYLPKGAKLIKNEGAGEVQTPVSYQGELELKHGDPIIMRHSKAGELCERFQCLYVIKDGKVIDTFSTYRGDGKCFL